MKKLIVLFVATLLSSVALAAGEFITLENGQVIAVPPKGQTCRYDPVFCIFGWKDDGSFPAIIWSDAITGQLQTCVEEARNYPLCPERDLSLGGQQSGQFPCYRLDTGED